MQLTVKVIPHEDQRYPTVGDWLLLPKDTIHVNVSAMGNTDYEFLVAIHELVEAHLCRKRSITESDVNDFDIKFEAGRIKGNTAEPGDHPLAPYAKEHAFATHIERQLAKELGVNWEEYDDTVNSL